MPEFMLTENFIVGCLCRAGLPRPADFLNFVGRGQSPCPTKSVSSLFSVTRFFCFPWKPKSDIALAFAASLPDLIVHSEATGAGLSVVCLLRTKGHLQR